MDSIFIELTNTGAGAIALLLLFGFFIGVIVAWTFLNYRFSSLLQEEKANSDLLGEKIKLQLENHEKNIDENRILLSENKDIRNKNSQLSNKVVELSVKLDTEREKLDEERALLADAKRELSSTFESLSASALQKNIETFMSLAKNNMREFQTMNKSELEKRKDAISDMVKPMAESLEKFDKNVQDLEKNRQSAYTALHEQIKNMDKTQEILRNEASQLVTALRQPTTRGMWGELQLKRVVELAGMQDKCDFEEQYSIRDDKNNLLRPDMLIQMPGNRCIAVDAKTPLSAYLNAISCDDEDEKSLQLAEHAKQVRNHVLNLSKKKYWDNLDPSPDFVVLFLPGESFFSTAINMDSGLIEFAMQRKVLIASPISLIAMLRAIAFGWRQESVTRNAQKISSLGKELYQRLNVLSRHFQKIGKNLNGAVGSYNDAVSSYESRVLTSAKRFDDLNFLSESEKIEEPNQVLSHAKTIDEERLLFEKKLYRDSDLRK